jgi:PhoPQ-activated pathogenicity-related protein
VRGAPRPRYAWRFEPDGTIVVEVTDRPAGGWTAFFVELTYPRGGGLPFKFTTGVRVTPDRLPFPPPERAPRR